MGGNKKSPGERFQETFGAIVNHTENPEQYCGQRTCRDMRAQGRQDEKLMDHPELESILSRSGRMSDDDARAFLKIAASQKKLNVVVSPAHRGQVYEKMSKPCRKTS